MTKLSLCVVLCALFALALGACRQSPACVCRHPVAEPEWIEVSDEEVAEEKAAPATKPVPPAANPIEAILVAKRVRGLTWDNVNMDQALTYLRTISGTYFYLSPKAREEKFDDIVINARLDDVSVKTVLDVVLTVPFDMHWVVKEGVVWLRTNEEYDGPMRLRYYDVKDLVGMMPPSQFSEVGKKPASASAKAAPELSPAASKARMGELVDAIRGDVASGYWEKEGVTLKPQNGILIIRASRPVLSLVDTYLTRQRAALRAPIIPATLLAKINATKVSMALDNVSVPDALKILQVQTGQNLMIDPRIEHEVAKQMITKLQIQDVSLMTALTLLQGHAGRGLIWQARGNVLVLVHREHLMGK